jgi:glycosyltransferase involved in cell wall biosynthesis
MQSLPMVSVVVPVRNGENTIEKLLVALLAQDYPKDKIQIIIVDNGSQDHTIEIIRKYPVALEHEIRIASSYAARNKGLAVANGEIIAFTDADCIPEKSWISKGVQALDTQNADMAGGKIFFLLSARPSVAEIIDSVTFMQNEQNIKNDRAAVTANLLVRKELFNKIGSFREIQSGEDFHWTQKATKHGFFLVYAEQAIVCHPARNLTEIIKKFWRASSISGYVEVGQVQKQTVPTKESIGYFKKIYVVIRLLFPVPSKKNVKLLITNREKGNSIFAVWGVLYLCQLTQFIALILYIFRKIKNKIIKDRLFFSF